MLFPEHPSLWVFINVFSYIISYHPSPCVTQQQTQSHPGTELDLLHVDAGTLQSFLL